VKILLGCSEPETFGNVYCALLRKPLSLRSTREIRGLAVLFRVRPEASINQGDGNVDPEIAHGAQSLKGGNLTDGYQS